MSGKKNKAQQDRRKAAKRERRAKRQQETRRSAQPSDRSFHFDHDGLPEPVLIPNIPLRPPRPENLLPPVYIDAAGQIVPDPRLVLGLGPEVTDEAQIRAAYRALLLESPPEQAPEQARLLREARDRLLDPARLLERELGLLHVPDAARWGFEVEPTLDAPTRLDGALRLAGQSVLYALVEDALWERGLREHLHPRESPVRKTEQQTLF